MRQHLRSLFFYLIDPAHFLDRRLQSCWIVMFFSGVIAYCLRLPSSDFIQHAFDVATVAVISAAGIYHFGRGFDDYTERRYGPSELIASRLTPPLSWTHAQSPCTEKAADDRGAEEDHRQ